MIKFVKSPNLPINCKSVIIGDCYLSSLDEPLKELGINTIAMPANTDISKQIAAHADMSVHHVGDNKVFLAKALKHSEFANNLSDLGFGITYAKHEQTQNYPTDVGLNSCSVGKWLITSKYIDEDLYKAYMSLNYNILQVRQGYCKCSCAVIDKKSIITADSGIAEVCKKNGIDVLQIQAGYIELKGYDYGFIGGSCFKLADNIIAFTGVLDDHPDKEKIITYLKIRGIEVIYLTDNKIFDIGGAIPILEQ